MTNDKNSSRPSGSRKLAHFCRFRLGRVVLAAFALASVSPPTIVSAQTNQKLIVPAAQVAYGIQGNMVFLRNLNTFDTTNTWLGCCYNYWFDLTTPGGQAAFSTFLSYRMTGQSIALYMATPTTAGPIGIVGTF